MSRLLRSGACAAALLIVLTGCARGGQAGVADAAITVDVFPRPDTPVAGEEVHWVIEVANGGDEPVTLLFRSTQRGDVVLTTAGVEVYRWAESRAFTPEVTEESVAPGASATYELTDRELAVAPGEYEVVATLNGLPVSDVVHASVTVAPPDS